MIAEIVGFLGTSVGGAVFGQISSFLQSRSEIKLREQQQQHEQNLAFKGAIGDYYANMGKSNPSFSHSLGNVIVMLAATYCVFTLWCIAYPETIVWTLDPSESPRKINFLFGIASYEWKREKILELTTGGIGLMLCYPIVFILSSVLTGVTSKRLR